MRNLINIILNSAHLLCLMGMLCFCLSLVPNQTIAQCPSCSGGPPPQGDDCANPIELDTLPAPIPCNGTADEGIGDTVDFNLTNVCATPGSPYLSITSCVPNGNNMANPADDIWAKVYVTGDELSISLNSNLSNTSVGLWDGDTCNSLVGITCARTGGGNLTANFDGLTPGFFFLQISGDSIGDQCDISLSLSNNRNCNNCVEQSVFTADPQPINGSYRANTTVEFCFTVTDFTIRNSNYFHGVEFDLGEGWVDSSLVTFPANSCDQQGSWGWHDTILRTAGNPPPDTFGPGFFYERGNDPNDPADNFGDDNTGQSCTWQFCVELTTPSCSSGNLNGEDLSININTLSDGQSGGWTTAACGADPTFNFSANLYCCTQPSTSYAQPTCPEGSDGWVSATGTGEMPWDYTWRDTSGTILRDTSGVKSSDTLKNISEGKYFVTVVDSLGCSASDTVTLSDPANWALSFDTTNISCFGGADGALDLTTNGATSPYTFSWSNGDSTEDISNLQADTFQVTVTDSLQCTYTDSAAVEEPDSITISANVVDAACNDSADGSIDISATGGTGAYSYNWSGGSTTQDTNNIRAGNYTVTVTDDNGCQDSASFTVNEPPALQLSFTTTPVTCFGNNDGAIDLAVSGGTGNNTYAWSSGSTTQDTSGIQSGIYTVTVTDGNGCTLSATDSVSQPDSLIAQADSIPVQCYGGSTGKAIALPNGGTTPYSYSWNDPSTQQDSVATGLKADTFSVTVTDDNGCQDSATVAVTQPDSITIDLDTIDVTCNNSTDGAVNSTVNGGVTPYSYQWSNGANSQDINNLGAGNYCLTVTDAKGCTKVACAEVSEPLPLTLSTSQQQANCNQSDGRASVTVTGGSPGYTYQWDDPANQKNDTAYNLTPGSYQVVVTDSVGCQDSTSVTVGNIAGPSVSITSSSDVSCFGGDDGSATASVSGGTTPYDYQWNDSLSQTTPTASDLRADTAIVIVTDSNNCTASDSVVISQPQPLSLTMDSVPTYCQQDSGSAMVDVTGGTSSYNYQWDDPDNQQTDSASTLGPGVYQVQVTDANSCTAIDSVEVSNLSGGQLIISDSTNVSCFSGNDGTAEATVINGTPPFDYQWDDPQNQMTSIATNLSAGTYEVTVIEGNGCTDSASVTITQPAQPLSLSLSADSATCTDPNGQAVAQVSGGTSPYDYQWDDPNNQAGDTASGLLPGQYSVTVTDSNSCTIIDSLRIGDYPPGNLSVNVVANVSCPGGRDGEAAASVNGGKSPFSYSWNDSLGQTTPNADSLEAGSYTVSVTDSVGCVLIDSVTIGQPSPFDLEMDSTTADCGQANGSASVSVSGGTPPYNYEWNDPAQQNTPTASNLTIGTYTVTVTDANNCSAIDSVEVINPDIGTPLISSTDVSCFNGSDGSASVSMNGGTPPFSYQWNDPNNQNSSTASGLSEGSYKVTVTDDAGCIVVDSVTIDQPQAPITIDSTNTTSATCGNANGTAYIAVSGGTVDSSHSYQWSNGQTSASADQLAEGGYTVTVTDDNGCTLTNSFTIDNIPGPTLQTQSSPVTCYEGSDGSASVEVNGGTSPYQTEWSNGEQDSTIDNISAGDYDVTVTDANNCQSVQTVTVGSPPAIVVDAGPDKTIKLGQSTDLSGNITEINYVQSYSWKPQNQVECPNSSSQECLAPTVEPRDTTTYILEALDENNCQYQDTVIVEVIIEPNVYAPNAFSPNKDEINDEFKIITRKVDDFKLQIFNRWGEKVFQSTDPEYGWDGTYKGNDMPPGTYIYVANLRYSNGKRKVLKGSVTLIR